MQFLCICYWVKKGILHFKDIFSYIGEDDNLSEKDYLEMRKEMYEDHYFRQEGN